MAIAQLDAVTETGAGSEGFVVMAVLAVMVLAVMVLVVADCLSFLVATPFHKNGLRNDHV